jgi:hypothetical protein
MRDEAKIERDAPVNRLTFDGLDRDSEVVNGVDGFAAVPCRAEELTGDGSVGRVPAIAHGQRLHVEEVVQDWARSSGSASATMEG